MLLLPIIVCGSIRFLLVSLWICCLWQILLLTIILNLLIVSRLCQILTFVMPMMFLFGSQKIIRPCLSAFAIDFPKNRLSRFVRLCLILYYLSFIMQKINWLKVALDVLKYAVTAILGALGYSMI